MKKLLLAAILLTTLPAVAQIPGVSVATYTTRKGTIFHKGDTLHLALGRADNGAYRYAYLPANFLLGTREAHLGSSWNNLNPVIKDIRAQKTVKNMAPRTVAVIGTGSINACVDLESAEEAGEIKTAANRNLASPAAAQAPAGASPADQLLKLKQLLDAGALTQQEYDEKKAQLLKQL